VEEVWYVLEGAGKIWRCPPDAAPETVPPVDISTGNSLVIPTGWSFQFSAGPDGPLRFLCHTTPPWPGETEALPVEHGGLGEATV
jgi:mannose-6-phosphate isomerase-like protein (cupin superfamily)